VAERLELAAFLRLALAVSYNRRESAIRLAKQGVPGQRRAVPGSDPLLPTLRSPPPSALPLPVRDSNIRTKAQPKANHRKRRSPAKQDTFPLPKPPPRDRSNPR